MGCEALYFFGKRTLQRGVLSLYSHAAWGKRVVIKQNVSFHLQQVVWRGIANQNQRKKEDRPESVFWPVAASFGDCPRSIAVVLVVEVTPPQGVCTAVCKPRSIYLVKYFYITREIADQRSGIALRLIYVHSSSSWSNAKRCELDVPAAEFR